MQNRLNYENLDTSFVNLAALVRFLRARKFDGNVRLELREYEGEILLSPNGEILTREHDRVSGRVAEGEEALQRLLIRAREPGGIVHVRQSAPETANTANNAESAAKLFINKKSELISPDIAVSNSDPVETFQQTLGETAHIAENQNFVNENKEISSQTQTISEIRPTLKSPDFPFEFTNQVEAKARRNQLSEADWQTFLSLIAELLDTIDGTLAGNNLNFGAAFQKASSETAGDYPFLAPNAGVFAYQNGKIEIRERVNAKLFAAGINETLRRILEKLAANPKLAEVYRETSQKILALIRERKPFYDQFFITPQLEKILGA